MKTTVAHTVARALESLGVTLDSPAEIAIPKEESHGDLSTAVALGLARTLRKAPRIIAEDIVAKIRENGDDRHFQNIEVAGAGFINFTFSPQWLHASLANVLQHGGATLHSTLGTGTRIQIEYVSANPTGPLHLGHGRGAALGHALANLLQAAGYEVEREYYVNDAGRQVQLLGHSVYARYQELCGVPCEFPEDGYRGDYIREAAQSLLDSMGDVHKGTAFESVREEFIQKSLTMMLAMIQKDLSDFAIGFDTWQSEQALHDNGAVTHAIEFLRNKGLIYDLEGAIWFRATEFGDDKDRVVIKNDGMHTYFASDIAYHLNKVERGFDEVINIWGADHHGYVARLEAVMDALGKGRDKLTVLLVQMVSLLRGGEPVQMSKRSGEFITMREVFEEVGADTTKFIFLTRRHDSQLSFDLETAKAASAENPVYYVQYANARIASMFNKAEEVGLDTSDLLSTDLSPLVEEDELRLIRKILHYRIAFEGAALTREPHRLTYYLQELSGIFHPFYNKHRVVDPGNVPLSRARLALCLSVREIIRTVLTLLGLTAPDRM